MSLAGFGDASNELFQLDLATMTTHLIVTGNSLTPRYFTQLAADAHGVLYLFGGRGEGFLGDLHRLDSRSAQRLAIASTTPAAPRWSQFSGGTAPAMRMGGGFVGSGTELYHFGGATNITIQGATLFNVCHCSALVCVLSISALLVEPFPQLSAVGITCSCEAKLLVSTVSYRPCP